MVNDLDFVLLCFKHAPWLLRVSVRVSRSLVLKMRREVVGYANRAYKIDVARISDCYIKSHCLQLNEATMLFSPFMGDCIQYSMQL